MRKSILSFAILAAICVIAGPQAAQAAYPTKPVTVTQGFKAGGGSDTLAQLTQPTLQKILGQSFINQYIPGATGAIAWTKLAKNTKADGYTLSITNTPMLQANYIMNPEVTYNIRELEPIANVVTDPGIIVVGKDSPFKTYQDYADACKASPGKLTVGNSGVGGDDFFTTILWMKNTGLKVAMVPFEGDGPSWQAAMAGKIDVSYNNLGITYPQIKAGSLRPLAIFAEKRYAGLPDVPTLKELGVNQVSGSSRGYCAPKGIPKDIRDKLIDAFKKMAADPDFIKGCEDRASPVDMHYGDAYMKFLADEETLMINIWNEVKKDYVKNQ
jgi:tripartite-type tricarboxylate transporter receptor subunit TctC